MRTSSISRHRGSIVVSVLAAVALGLLVPKIREEHRRLVANEQLARFSDYAATARREALAHLVVFTRTRSAVDFSGFERAMERTLVQRTVREAMESEAVDGQRVAELLVGVGYPPGAVADFVEALPWIRDLGEYESAVGLWTLADTKIDRILREAFDLRSQILQPSPSERASLSELRAADQELAALIGIIQGRLDAGGTRIQGRLFVLGVVAAL
ncbi:MAG: hypothetical protein R3190_08115, partial [Thermoanaerobaculia bacterium]|nr:hypothetical protein [Thermoanaerobaculia bacterium]